MSDNIKLVIEIDKETLERIITHAQSGFHSYPDIYALSQAFSHGKHLSDVLDGIKNDIDINGFTMQENNGSYTQVIPVARAKYLIDKWEYVIDKCIGKADKSCSTCKNNDDELSGECYECLKGIFDHYESEDV